MLLYFLACVVKFRSLPMSLEGRVGLSRSSLQKKIVSKNTEGKKHYCTSLN